MRARLLALLVLWAAAVSFAADEPPVVRRATLVVHDIEASIRFYRDVLGFELWLDNRSKVGVSSLPVDLPAGSPSRFAIMKGRHPWVGMVGLLQYGPARARPEPPAAVQPGDVVLMIESHEVEAIFGRMQAAGVKVLRAPEKGELQGANGTKWATTFLFAYDPDGHLLEISERRPAAGALQNPAAAPPVRRGYVPMRFGQLHVRSASPAQSGGLRAPVVMLHDALPSGRAFGELLPALARDRIVHAPDLPGCGESDPPPKPLALAEHAAALHDFIADLQEPVDLVGYRSGALLAAEIALRHPQSVRRLVLISVPLLPAEEGAQPDAAPGVGGEGACAGWAVEAAGKVDVARRLAALRQPVTILRPGDGPWEDGARAAGLVREALDGSPAAEEPAATQR